MSEPEENKLEGETLAEEENETENDAGTSAKRKREEEADEDEGAEKKVKDVQAIVAEQNATAVPVAAAVIAPMVPTGTIQTTLSATTNTATVGRVQILSTLSPDGATEMIEVPPDRVGAIIGTKGSVILDMQTRSGAKMLVNQEFPPGVNRQVTITGTPSQVKIAGDLVKLILEHGPTAIHANSMSGGPTVNIVIECPQSVVGRVIGGQGNEHIHAYLSIVAKPTLT